MFINGIFAEFDVLPHNNKILTDEFQSVPRLCYYKLALSIHELSEDSTVGFQPILFRNILTNLF